MQAKGLRARQKGWRAGRHDGRAGGKRQADKEVGRQAGTEGEGGEGWNGGKQTKKLGGRHAWGACMRMGLCINQLTGPTG